ncbi:hypothetical protein ACVMII_001337 [Bradyrhizobium diazoefficiens]
MLLGLKGSISELELHTIRSRLTAGLLAKAERGELAVMLPIGLMRDPSGVVVVAILSSGTPGERDLALARIVWRGGAVTELEVKMSVNSVILPPWVTSAG